MAKQKKADVQAKSNDETASRPDDGSTRELGWSLGGSEKVKFLVERPRTLAEMLDPSFGGRNAPFATSEQAIVDKAFGQGCVDIRRQAIDAGLFGSEDEPKTPTVEEAREFYLTHSISETRGGRTKTKKVRKVSKAELEGLSAEEKLAKLEALYVE